MSRPREDARPSPCATAAARATPPGLLSLAAELDERRKERDGSMDKGEVNGVNKGAEIKEREKGKGRKKGKKIKKGKKKRERDLQIVMSHT
jgi:hypothetical protein